MKINKQYLKLYGTYYFLVPFIATIIFPLVFTIFISIVAYLLFFIHEPLTDWIVENIETIAISLTFLITFIYYIFINRLVLHTVKTVNFYLIALIAAASIILFTFLSVIRCLVSPLGECSISNLSTIETFGGISLIYIAIIFAFVFEYLKPLLLKSK